LKKAELARKRAISGAEKLRRLKEETVKRLLESEDTSRTRKLEKNAQKMQQMRMKRQANPYSTIRYVSRQCERKKPDGEVELFVQNRLAMPLGYKLEATGKKLIMSFAGYGNRPT